MIVGSHRLPGSGQLPVIVGWLEFLFDLDSKEFGAWVTG